MIEHGEKNIFARVNHVLSKIVSKSIQTLFESVEKLVNPDEKVIWSFLTLTAKNKFDEKGTLSLISYRVSFLLNARKGLILVFKGIVFHYICLNTFL